MAKVQQNWEDQPDHRLTVVMDGPTASHVRYEESMRAFWRVVSKFAVPEGSTLAGAARTDDPPAVLMSGGEEPAGAAKQRRPYFVESRAHKWAYTRRYTWNEKRARFALLNASQRMSKWAKGIRDQRPS